MGSTCNRVLCQMLDLTPGKYLETPTTSDSSIRNKVAGKAFNELTKKRRRHVKCTNVAKQNNTASKEGESYASSSFTY